MNSADSTAAQTYALVFGAVLLLVGLLGFAYEASFSGDDRDALLGIFDVNGVHNVVHILSGLLGLAAWRAGAAASRQFALGFGVVYLLVAIWGFAVGDGGEILGLIPVNTEDNLLHVAISVLGIAAGLASSDTRTTRAAAV